MPKRQCKRVGIYLRVSTKEQSTRMQERQLRAFVEQRGWVVSRVFQDKGISGTVEDRPALKELMMECRKRRLDAVVVWKFDRFARSLKHLVTALEELRKLKVDFVSLTEAVDTSIPSGELVFHIFAAIAQFERSLIGERVRAGLQHARAEGVELGRPRKYTLSSKQQKEIREARATGKFTLKQLSKQFGLPVWRIFAATRKAA